MSVPIHIRGERISFASSKSHRPKLRLTAIAIATALVAGLSATGASLPAVADPLTIPLFDDAGLAIEVFNDSTTWIHGEAWVESPVDSDHDGKLDLVHIDYNIPGETATEGLRVPSIIELSPYFAGTPGIVNYNVFHEVGEPTPLWGTDAWHINPPSRGWTQTSPKISNGRVNDWVSRGFAVVHAESLGTGYSQGCPTAGGPEDAQAGKAVIQWLTGDAKAFTSTDRTQEVKADWSTGKAALIGKSYPAIFATMVASTGVKGLEAIVAYSGLSSWYDYYRAGGAVRNPAGYAGEDMLQVSAGVYSRQSDRDLCLPIFEQTDKDLDQVTGDYNQFWDDHNYLNGLENFRAAVLVSQGFNDWNVKPTSSANLYTELKKAGKDVRVYFHQLAHVETGPTLDQLNAFFSHYLYGISNSASENKAVIANSNLSGTTAGTQVYEDFPQWPIPGTSDVKLNLVGASGLGDGDLALTKTSSQPVQTFEDDTRTEITSGSQLVDGVRYLGSGTNADLPYVNTDPAFYLSDNRLIYTTPTLRHDVRISGFPKINIKAAVNNKTKATLSALLAYISPTGTTRIVSRGWVDVENRNSIYKTDPITAGEFYNFPIEFEPQDWIFKSGGQIALVLLSSDPGYTIRPAPGTQIAVQPDQTQLILPVVDGAGALQSAVGLFADVAAVEAVPAAVSVTAGQWLSVGVNAFTTWNEDLGEVGELVSFRSTVASDTFEDGIFVGTEPGERTITLTLGTASTQFKLAVIAKPVDTPEVTLPTAPPVKVEDPPAKVSVAVTFKVNGGKALAAARATKSVTQGEVYGALPTPTRVDYSFTGWFTQKTGGTKVTDSTTVTGDAAITLYAHWKKIVKVGKVTSKSLVIRKAAKASGKAIGTYKKGKTFTIVKKLDRKGTANDWYQIKYKGKQAFVSIKNVKVSTKK